MTEIKQKALEKMLKEMNKNHSGAEDVIHNWLCDQDDEKLLEGILKEDRSIKGAMQYCVSQASKQQSDNAAMVDAQTVFLWVNTYFVSGKAPEIDRTVSAKVDTDGLKVEFDEENIEDEVRPDEQPEASFN